MENPFLKINQQRPPQKKGSPSFGYEISHSKEAVSKALEKGKNLVLEMQRTGKDLRSWSKKTMKETDKLMTKLSKKSSSQKKKNSSGPDKRIWEIAYWENEISRMIRVYFGDISNQMAELKKLNPPLKSDQLENFLQEMLKERRETLVTLEPLSKKIDELQKIKSALMLESNQSFRFQPLH